MDSELLEALRHYARVNYLEDWELGCHSCEMCNQAEGQGEFFVDWSGMRYVLPLLVLHYCEVHDYLPPSEFLSALGARWSADRKGSTG